MRARETGEQQTIDTTNARVISNATPPRDKSWPPRGILLMAALVGGLGTGAGVGLMRDYLDEAVHTPRQLELLVPVPVLAALPKLSGARSHHLLNAPGNDPTDKILIDNHDRWMASLMRWRARSRPCWAPFTATIDFLPDARS